VPIYYDRHGKNCNELLMKAVSTVPPNSTKLPPFWKKAYQLKTENEPNASKKSKDMKRQDEFSAKLRYREKATHLTKTPKHVQNGELWIFPMKKKNMSLHRTGSILGRLKDHSKHPR
jgi:hypothetical protein